MSRTCSLLMGAPRQHQPLLQRLRLGVEAGEEKVKIGFSEELGVEDNGCTVARLARSSCHRKDMATAINKGSR